MKTIHNNLDLFLTFLFASFACKEKEGDNTGWTVCNSCTIESGKGIFSGVSSCFDAAILNAAENIEITIRLEETEADCLTEYMAVPNCLNVAINGELNNTCSISFAGSTAPLNATLQAKALKPTGTVNKFHMKADSLIVNEVVSFVATRIAQ